MRSFIDPNQQVKTDRWVVSLICKPRAAETGGNPEHAFIILEGLEKNKENGEEVRVFERYDFVTPKPAEAEAKSAVSLIQRKPGLVIISKKNAPSTNDAESKRYFWSEVIKDVDREQGCQGASWALPLPIVEQLHTNVMASQKNPPDYQILGPHSLFAASSSQSGHNCYTWGRNQLRALNVPVIKQDTRLDLSLLDFLVAQTTRHLTPPIEQLDEEPSSPSCLIS